MRTFVLSAAAFVLVTGCSASVSIGTDSSSSGAASAGASTAASAAPASPDAPAASGGASGGASSAPAASAAPSIAPGFTLVSANLADGGHSGFSAVGGLDSTVAAATYTYVGDQTDAGLVYSTDAGMTWARGGVVPLPGSQQVSGVMVTDKGVVMVGSTSSMKGNDYHYKALILAAPAPDYVPQVVPNPAEFNGDLRLVAVFKDGADWVILGSTVRLEKGGGGDTNDFPTVWRSSDEGSTWTRNVLSVAGSVDTPVYDFAMGPDGSWNLFGQYDPNNNQQFNAAWLQSTDAGASFALMDTKVLSKKRDQGVYDGAFSSSGAVALSGWNELSESTDHVSFAWAGSAGQAVQPLGPAKLLVEGGTPPGEFMDGLMWDNDTLVMWGSADGSYPMPDVQFWGWDGTQFVPTTTMPGNGELLAVQRIVGNGGTVLAFGSTGPDKETRNLGIWVGSLAQQ